MTNEDGHELLRRVLEGLGWTTQEGRTPGAWFVDFGEPHLPVSSAIAAITENEHLLFYAVLGVAAAPDVRDEAMRFVTRANYGLAIGNWEIDLGDGQIQFHSGLDLTGLELSEQLVVNVIVPAMAAVEQYAEALLDVLAGRSDAQEAIARAESG
jgi:hypothetical protein